MPLLGALLAALVLGSSRAESGGEEQALRGPLREGTCRTDATWNDGRAEKCVYEATRTIYGAERRYRAVAYTHQEDVDPQATV